MSKWLRRKSLDPSGPSPGSQPGASAVDDNTLRSTAPEDALCHESGVTVKAEQKKLGRVPWLLRYRSSTAFIALTVGLGVLVDLAGYGLVVPVVPFRLEELGYDNVSSRTGWLVAAYGAGLTLSSPPIAWVGARTKNRQWPLVFFLLFMAGGIILFMETKSYTALVIARVLQGISGTGIWTLGLALITDSVPEERVGIVMGYTMIGFTLGQLIGPPVGGVLYQRLGYRAPFVFGICLVAADLALRLLMVEKHTAAKYIRAGLVDIPGFECPSALLQSTRQAAAGDSGDAATVVEKAGKAPVSEVSLWQALGKMCRDGRPMTAYALTLINGITLGGLLDAGMTLNLNDVYGLDSLGAGLVFIGAVAPTIVASPFAGWVADKRGAKWICSLGVLMSVAVFPLFIIRGPLPLFVFFLVLLGTSLSFFLTPVSQDLSVVVAQTPGLPSTFAYGSFNMSYSLGSFVGPLAAGQILEALGIRRGWLTLCVLCSGLSAIVLPFVVWYIGGPIKKVVPRDTDKELGDVGKEVKDV